MWSYSKRAGCACVASGSRKLLKPMPTSRKRCSVAQLHSLAQRQRDGRQLLARRGRRAGCMTTCQDVEVACLQLEDHCTWYTQFLTRSGQTFSVRVRIIGSVSDNGTSRSKVSSAEIDLGGLFGTTWLLSMPRDNS